MYKRVLISNFPNDIDSTDLELILEDHNSPFKSVIEKIEIKSELNSAIVSFATEFDKSIIPKDGVVKISSFQFDMSVLDDLQKHDDNEVQVKKSEINNKASSLLNNISVPSPLKICKKIENKGTKNKLVYNEEESIFSTPNKSETYNLNATPSNNRTRQKLDQNTNDKTKTLIKEKFESHNSNDDDKNPTQLMVLTGQSKDDCALKNVKSLNNNKICKPSQSLIDFKIEKSNANLFQESNQGKDKLEEALSFSDYSRIKESILNDGEYEFSNETYKLLEIIASKNNGKIGDLLENFNFIDEKKILTWSSHRTFDDVKISLLQYTYKFERTNFGLCLSTKNDMFDQLLNNCEFLEIIQRVICDLNLTAFVYNQDSTLFIISPNESVINESINVIDSKFSEFFVTFDETELNLTSTKDLVKFTDELKKEFHYDYKILDQALRVFVFLENADAEKDLKTKIEMWIKDNSWKTYEYKMDKMQFFLAANYIEEKFKSEKNLKITCDSTNLKINIVGVNDEVAKVVSSVDEACKKIYKFEHKANNLFLDFKLFDNDGAGDKKLKSLECEYKCLITAKGNISSLNNDWEPFASYFKSMSKRLFKNAETLPGKSTSNLVEDSLPSIPLRSGSTDSIIKTFSQKINLKKMSIVDIKVDVLVNVISSKTGHLNKAGVISKIFLAAGGEVLQTNLNNAKAPRKFGEISKTVCSGTLTCQQVYHTVVLKNINSKSLELLEETLTNCLKTAVADKMSSIAFPAVGCGKLHFSPVNLVLCLINALKNSNVPNDFEVYLVTPDAGQFAEFTKLLNDTSLLRKPNPLTSDKEIVRPNKEFIDEKGDASSKEQCQTLDCFQIHSLTESDSQQKIETKISKLLDNLCDNLYYEKEITKINLNVICPLISTDILKKKKVPTATLR